jgi:hypothetical protein
VFSDLLPSNGCPIVARFGFRGNMFIELLLSNGYTRYSIIERISKNNYRLFNDDASSAKVIYRRMRWEGHHECEYMRISYNTNAAYFKVP